MVSIEERKKGPEVREQEYFKLPQVERLSSRLPFFGYKESSVPLLKLELLFEAGKQSESMPGASFLTSKMLFEGTEKYGHDEVHDIIAKYGAHIEFNAGLEKLTCTLYTQHKYAEIMISFFFELIYEASFPATQFDQAQQIAIQDLKIRNEKTAFVATNVFREHIFPDPHPYGKTLTEENIANATLEGVKEFHSNLVSGVLPTVFISGDYSEEQYEMIESIISSKSTAETKGVVDVPQKQAQLHIEKEGAIQSSLRLGRKSISRDHVDFLDLLITNELLGGYFGSRLMKNIREEKGLTYGIYSQNVTLPNGAYWVIAADVKKELVSQAIEEINKEINLLKTELVSDSELEVVTNYMAGSFLSSINTPFDIVDKFKTIHYSGLDYSYFELFYNRLKTITPIDIQKTAQKYFSVDVEVIVG